MYKRQLPILFLFGDRHNSMSQLCKNCKCDGPDDESCCLEIFSDTFLELLDGLSKDRKVSFYTEFFEPKHEKELWLRRPHEFAKQLDQRLSTPPKGVMNQLRERLVACYLDTSIKAHHSSGHIQLKKFCPTNLMDWEYADLRQLNTNATIDTLVSTEPYYYEAVLFRILYFIFLYVEGESKENMVLDEDFDPIRLAKQIGPSLAKDLFHSVSLLLRDPTSFANWFVSTKNSLGNKSRLRTMATDTNIISLDQLRDWLVIELEYYTHQGSWLHDTGVKKWSDYFDSLSKGSFISSPSKQVKIAEPIVFIDTCLPFLDLYFLLHAFHKKGLCIGYFGSTHIQGMVNLIVHRLGLYTEISNIVKGEKGTERCLVLDKIDWNLDSILEDAITGVSSPIEIPKVKDSFIPAGRILHSKQVLDIVKSPKQKIKVDQKKN
jgi:hypothetical protein